MKTKKKASDGGPSSLFIRIGTDTLIRESDIVGIFDTDSSTASSPITKRYLSEAEKSGSVESAGSDIPKSFVLCRERDPGGGIDGKKVCRFKIVFSDLSSAVILQRGELLH